MEASDRVTWMRCPNCQRPAAVGWLDARPIEFDCPGGCHPSEEQVQALADGRGRSPAAWLTRP
jgi:hypothetical protein